MIFTFRFTNQIMRYNVQTTLMSWLRLIIISIFYFVFPNHYPSIKFAVSAPFFVPHTLFSSILTPLGMEHSRHTRQTLLHPLERSRANSVINYCEPSWSGMRRREERLGKFNFKHSLSSTLSHPQNPLVSSAYKKIHCRKFASGIVKKKVR